MRMPKLATTIDRRLFVTYRLAPELLEPILPAGLEPEIIRGQAVAGICLIRLTHMRPRWFKPDLGVSVENVAHRIAIRYTDEAGDRRSGVYIPERHTSSRLAAGVGSALLPGVYKGAKFDVAETETSFDIAMRGAELEVALRAEVAEPQQWASALFADAEAASDFYKYAPIAISPAPGGQTFETLELATKTWATDPVRMVQLRSTFYDRMPQAKIQLDHALVMRHISAEWGTPRAKGPRTPARFA